MEAIPMPLAFSHPFRLHFQSGSSLLSFLPKISNSPTASFSVPFRSSSSPSLFYWPKLRCNSEEEYFYRCHLWLYHCQLQRTSLLFSTPTDYRLFASSPKGYFDWWRNIRLAFRIAWGLCILFWFLRVWTLCRFGFCLWLDRNPLLKYFKDRYKLWTKS